MSVLPSRREILGQTVLAPLAFASPVSEGRRDCLWEESAEGFRSVLSSCGSKDLIILPAVRSVTQSTGLYLRKRANSGALIIWESAGFFAQPRQCWQERRILGRTFGLGIQEPVAASADRGMYLKYRWPAPLYIRTFAGLTPVKASNCQVIAEYAGQAVCVRQSIGRGGIIFLGSMLGPNLRAGEREAQHFLEGLVRRPADFKAGSYAKASADPLCIAT